MSSLRVAQSLLRPAFTHLRVSHPKKALFQPTSPLLTPLAPLSTTSPLGVKEIVKQAVDDKTLVIEGKFVPSPREGKVVTNALKERKVGVGVFDGLCNGVLMVW